ncbi:MAG: HAMP domain-containing histidine kinase [Clostridiales bacterium]|nr:HAMP domain-containing histidine kinase [Clostridiales bacterium]
MVLLWVVIGLLAVAVMGLLLKVLYLKKSAREIEAAFSIKLSEDTNTLIDISSRDPDMRRLATSINGQLRQLRRERLRYQHGDQELKTAVTNISHDLRTPLTAISGYLELLEQEEKSETVQRYLAQIENRTEAMKQLTAELFRYSIVTSVQKLKQEPIDMVSALETSLLSFYGAMQEQGISPVLELPERPVVRYLDPGAVSRIFSNIIGNALKYSDGDLEVSMSERGTIIFSNKAKGLDSVTVGRLFDRFFTVEANRHSTGLGLSIARTLTEQMGGQINADFKNGRLSIIVSFQ